MLAQSPPRQTRNYCCYSFRSRGRLSVWKMGEPKKGYKSSNDENGAENVLLEGKQCQAHVGEDEVLCQEV